MNSTVILLIILVLVILYFIYEYYNSNKPIHVERFDAVSEQLNKNITEFMKKYNIPAGQISIIQDNKIVYSNSFGSMNCIDSEINGIKNIPVTNDTVFRIASCSKPITAMGILYLISNNELKFTDKAFLILAQAGFIDMDTIVDNRLKDITILNLLRHEGGWDSDMHFENNSVIADPQTDAFRIATNDPLQPANNVEIIQYMVTQPLDFTPGTKSVYSNFGYNVLGRVIEAISGESYEDFIKQNIFSKVGITNAYIGNELLENRGLNEVMYCDQELGQRGYAIDPNIKFMVDTSYGNKFIMRAMDSHGGWVMSTTSLAKFGNGIITNKYFSSKLLNVIYNKPYYVTGNSFYSLGLNVESNKNGILLSHAGSLQYGTFALLIIVPKQKLTLAATFNHSDTDVNAMATDLFKILLPSYF